MRRIGSLLFVLLFGLSSVAEISVQSVVDKPQVPMGETLVLTVSVNSTENVEINEPRVPKLDGFDLLNTQRSSSTSSSLIQDNSGMRVKTTRRVDFGFVLTPQRKGKLTIGGFEVNAGGRIFRTKPIQVEVIGDGSRPITRNQNDRTESEDRFSQLLRQRAELGKGYKSLPKNTNEAFFIQIDLDKTEVYAGEQILAKWYLYSRGQVEHIDRLKFPTLRGFWKEDVEAAPSLNFRQEVINGVVYRKALLASHALFAIKPGVAVIDEYKVKAIVRMSSGNFGIFSFGKPYTYTKSSERLKIKVKELPSEGQPKDFSGAIGNFEVGSTVEGRRFPVNQPFTLKIRFEGRGNAKLIDLPPIDLPAELELYDTKQEAKFFKNGTSFKDFELLLIPRAEGELTIPGISTSVFNPDTQTYETKRTDPFVVNIFPAKQKQIVGKSFGDETPEKAAEKKPEIPSINVNISGSKKWSNKNIAAAWGSVFFALFLVLGFKARKELGWGSQRFDLNKVVDERFQSIRTKIGNDNWRSSGTEMANVTYAVLGELAGLGGASVEVEKIIEKLPPSVRREVGEKLLTHVNQIQIISFAPEAVVGKAKQKDNLKTLAKSVQEDLIRAIKLYDKTDEAKPKG